MNPEPAAAEDLPLPALTANCRMCAGTGQVGAGTPKSHACYNCGGRGKIYVADDTRRTDG